MSNPSAKSSLLPSILDRLIEPKEGESADLGSRGQSVRELEEAVRRDLQDLLNTRRTAIDGFPEDVELSRSLLTFGLPELIGLQSDCARPAEVAARHHRENHPPV